MSSDNQGNPASESRPNILFAFADDWGRYASAYAAHEGEHSLNTLIDTPHFDRVAAEGVLFTNTLVPAPSCTPCRSSVLSGRYFWQTGLGAILAGAVWDRAIPSYPFMLQDSGYHIGFSYKVWSPGTPQDDPYGGKGSRYQNCGVDFRQFSIRATEWAEESGGIEPAKKRLYDEVRGNFQDFLDDRVPGQPFCYWWGPTNTHREWQKGSGKELWGIDPDSLRGRLPHFLPDVHEVREDVADYLGECMAVDAGLGLLIGMLEEMGELDNTLIVVSGDHGIPGFPRGKCNLYDIGCEVALAARLPGTIPPGRVAEDMVNIMDLAPTFLEVAGVEPPKEIPARSLKDILGSDRAGQVSADRTFVITGRERHVAHARDRNLPYPHRAIRTHDFLYIRNFAPDRWPAGDPHGMDDLSVEAPPYEELEHDTYLAYADIDASPTKAWMIHNRADEEFREVFQIGFGKRPAEELYDVRNDPHHMKNLARDPDYTSRKQALSEKLEAVLREQNDPRMSEGSCRYDNAPFTDWPCPEETAEKRAAMVRETILTDLPKLS